MRQHDPNPDREVVTVGRPFGRRPAKTLAIICALGSLLVLEGLAGERSGTDSMLVLLGVVFLWAMVKRLRRPPRMVVREGTFSIRFPAGLRMVELTCSTLRVANITLLDQKTRVRFTRLEGVQPEGLRPMLAENYEKKGAHLELDDGVFSVEQVQQVRDSIGVREAEADERGNRVDAFHRTLAALTPRAFVTPTVIGINGAVFTATVVGGVHALVPTAADLVGWGANFGPMTTHGQWWRLLTCTFLHIGIVHLAFNMWVLWDVGRLVERLVGNTGFAVIYLLSGAAGSLTSVWWHPGIVSAGASGAVFGIYGALLGFLALRRRSVPPGVLRELRNSTLGFLFFNLVYGLSEPGIDLAAHVGGLACGFVCGHAMTQPLVARAVAGRRVRNIAVAVVGVVALVIAAARVPSAETPGMSKDEVSRALKAAMEEAWARTPAQALTKVSSVELAHKGGGQYTGTVRAERAGEALAFAVKVGCDGVRIRWQITASEDPEPAATARAKRPPPKRMSTDELARSVAESIRRRWAATPEHAGTVVGHLQLMRQGDNDYSGTLFVRRGGQRLTLPVRVAYDGKRFMWQILD